MICAIVRWLVSRELDEGRPIPAFARRHAERCDACRSFRLACTTLAARLTGEARAGGRPVWVAGPAAFASVFGWRTAAAVAAGCAVIALLLWLPAGGHSRSGQGPGGMRENARTMVETMPALPVGVWNARPEGFLREEMARLADDAQSALRFGTAPISL